MKWIFDGVTHKKGGDILITSFHTIFEINYAKSLYPIVYNDLA